jgi:hypothetical protein
MITIRDLVTEFLKESKSFKQSTEKYPSDLEPTIQTAVQQKRMGLYLESVKTYLDLFKSEGVIYSAIVIFLYKVVAASGYLVEGMLLLELGEKIYQKDPGIINTLFSSINPSTFVDHKARLLNSIYSKQALFEYLKSVSGSQNFKFNREYSVMIQEIITKI